MNGSKSPRIVAAGFLVAVLVAGCAPRLGEVVVTRSPDSKNIPSTIAVYPLLTTYRSGRVAELPLDIKRESKRVYLAPPSQSELGVTLQSQLFGDLLAADLTYHGFKLKQLTAESSENDRGGNQFFVSLDELRHLADEYGLEAVLLGNIYFSHDRDDPAFDRVRAAYIKVVDVRTLDVLCHVSMTHDFYGADFKETVAQIATELASMANVKPVVPQKVEE